MSMIGDFEQGLISSGMREGDLDEYAKLLNRVRSGFLKRQHCYTTAVRFPSERAEQAVKLIEFGLESFEDDGWYSNYASYRSMGQIYERAGNYRKAYESYLSAMNALGEVRDSYEIQMSSCLMWMKLHIDSFKYSEEAEKYYSCAIKGDEFYKAFVDQEFRTAVAETVIFLHHGRADEARRSLERAREIAKPNYIGRLHAILARHRYNEKLKLSPEAARFINETRILT